MHCWDTQIVKYKKNLFGPVICVHLCLCNFVSFFGHFVLYLVAGNGWYWFEIIKLYRYGLRSVTIVTIIIFRFTYKIHQFKRKLFQVQ